MTVCVAAAGGGTLPLPTDVVLQEFRSRVAQGAAAIQRATAISGGVAIDGPTGGNKVPLQVSRLE